MSIPGKCEKHDEKSTKQKSAWYFFFFHSKWPVTKSSRVAVASLTPLCDWYANWRGSIILWVIHSKLLLIMCSKHLISRKVGARGWQSFSHLGVRTLVTGTTVDSFHSIGTVLRGNISENRGPFLSSWPLMRSGLWLLCKLICSRVQQTSSPLTWIRLLSDLALNLTNSLLKP